MSRAIWFFLLLGIFVFGVVFAFRSGDFRWLALSVVPGAIFAKWWRVT